MFSSYNTWATTQDRLSAIQKQQQKSERISKATSGKPRQRKPENKGKHRVVKTSKTNTRVISDRADVDITFLTTKNRRGQGRPTNAQRRERSLNEAFKFREDERNRSRNVGQDIADALRPFLAQQQQQAPRPAVVIPAPPVVQRDIRQQQQQERAERQQQQQERAERQREIARREAIEDEQLRREDARYQEQVRLDYRRLDIEERRIEQNQRGIAEINARLDGLDARVRAGQEIAPPQITINPNIKVEPRIEGAKIEAGAIVIDNTNRASERRGRRTNVRRGGGLGHRRRDPDTSSSESETSGGDDPPAGGSPRRRATPTSRRTPAPSRRVSPSNLPSVPEARSGEEEAQTLLEIAGGLGQRGAEALGGALYNVGAQATSTIGGVVSQGVRRGLQAGYEALPSAESITEAVRGLGRDTPLTQRETIENIPEEPLTSGGEEAGQVLIRTDEPLSRFREGYFVVGQRGSGASDTESSGAESGVLVSPPPKTKVPPAPEPEREPVARPKTMADRVRERLAQQEEERQALIRQEEEERERRRTLREQQARARRKQDIQGQLLESIQDEGARRQLEEAERGGFQSRPSPDSLRKLQRPPKGSSDSDSTRRSSESGSEYADLVRRGLESDVSLSGGEGGIFTLSDLEREPTEKRPAPTLKELQEDPFKILDVVKQDPTADVLREAVSDPDSPPTAERHKRGLVAVARHSESESETSPDEEEKYRDVKKLSPKQLLKTAETLQKQQIDADRRLQESEKQLEEQKKLVEAVEEIAFLEEADLSSKPVKSDSESEISDFLGTSEEERERRRVPEAQRSAPIPTPTGSLPRREKDRAFRGSSYTSSEGEDVLGATPLTPEQRKQLQSNISRRYGLTKTASTEQYQSNAERLADLNRQLSQVESDIQEIVKTKKKSGLESKRAVADKLRRDIETLQSQQEDFLFRGEAPTSEGYSPLESEVYKYLGRSQGGSRTGSGRPPKSEIPENERVVRDKIIENVRALQGFNPISDGNITKKGRQKYMDSLLGAMDMEGVNRAMIIYDEIVELKRTLRKLKKSD